MTRQRPTARTEESVLHRARRRCCLCVYLEGEYRVRSLQLAHIDRNPSNSSEENLAPLCLDHHNEYDTIPRQSKRLTPDELLRYRDAWYFEATQRYPIKELAVSPAPNRRLAELIRSHSVFRAVRRTSRGERLHEWLEIRMVGTHLTVQAPEWISVGPLRKAHYVGRFRYFRGETWKDFGTHDLRWTGREFAGTVRFDYPEWGSDDIVWRPE